jgi:hypothetical protein
VSDRKKKWSKLEIYICYTISNHGNHGKLLFFHSYECQGIQTKNSFDESLNLSFDFGPLKVNIYFAKDHQKDSFNIKNLMGKKLRG